ncbi:unnamed protein product, partial [marine sediment metagenome]
ALPNDNERDGGQGKRGAPEKVHFLKSQVTEEEIDNPRIGIENVLPQQGDHNEGQDIWRKKRCPEERVRLGLFRDKHSQ